MRATQQGVALAIVVWFIAGMSLLVAGIVSHARVDTQMTQLHVARAKAVAAGDGAIQLVMAERMLTQNPTGGGGDRLTGKVRLGSSEVSVTLYPTAGLVDLNLAPQKVLAALFTIVGQAPEDEANLLADNVVKWRGGFSGQGNEKAWVREFREVEDLIRVEGVGRTLFEAVRDFIVANKGSGTTTDWAVAPDQLLQVLEQVNPGELEAVARRRELLVSSDERTEGEPGAGGSTLSGTYRADALVTYGDQTWLRRRWVSVGSVQGSALPWRAVRTEPPRVHERSNEVL
jgi:hypothetical protein